MAISPVSFCDRLSSAAGNVQQFVSNCPSALFKRTIEPLVGYILKVCLFREAALRGRVGQWVILPLTAKIGNLWMRCQGLPPKFTVFNEERLKASRAFLAEFGMSEQIETGDGRVLKFTHYTPLAFDRWIDANGGCRDGDLIRPNGQEDQEKFQRLKMFKFEQNEDGSFRVPARIDGADSKCVLHCNGFGLPQETAKNFIGLHIAAGFHYTIFEWGENVSIPAFFNDAESAYQATLQKGFVPGNITALGYCGTTYVVANLQKDHYAEGLNAALIGPHTSFREVVSHANRIGLLGLGAVETPDANFDNINKFKTFEGEGGSTCLIMNPTNAIAAPDTIKRLEDSLCKANYQTILKPEDCSDEQFDFNRQFNVPGVWKDYTEFLMHKRD